MRSIFTTIFLVLFSLFILRAALYTIISVFDAEFLHPWPEIVGGGLVILVVAGHFFKIRAAESKRNKP